MSQARPELVKVASYSRDLPVSGERVWENVRDWEHLPWLHGSSFSSIELVAEGDWGWRARIGLPAGQTILLELVIEAPASDGSSSYVSRTLEGPGAGSEIWTRVEERAGGPTDPEASHRESTHVNVTFWLPGVRGDQVTAIGAHFVALYTRLWDEDESMMRERARALAEPRERRGAHAPASERLSLGTLEQLRPRLPLVVRFGDHDFRLVERDGALIAHSVTCPHRLGPLGEAPVEDGRVVCPWHGYAFELATGRECSGRRLQLRPAPRVELDERGRVFLTAGP